MLITCHICASIKCPSLWPQNLHFDSETLPSSAVACILQHSMEYGLTKLLTCTWVFVWKKVCTVLFNPFSVSLQEQYVCKTVQCVFLIHKHNNKAVRAPVTAVWCSGMKHDIPHYCHHNVLSLPPRQHAWWIQNWHCRWWIKYAVVYYPFFIPVYLIDLGTLRVIYHSNSDSLMI